MTGSAAADFSRGSVTLAPRAAAATAAGTPAIGVHGFQFAYGPRKVIHGLDLAIARIGSACGF